MYFKIRKKNPLHPKTNSLNFWKILQETFWPLFNTDEWRHHRNVNSWAKVSSGVKAFEVEQQDGPYIEFHWRIHEENMLVDKLSLSFISAEVLFFGKIPGKPGKVFYIFHWSSISILFTIRLWRWKSIRDHNVITYLNGNFC